MLQFHSNCPHHKDMKSRYSLQAAATPPLEMTWRHAVSLSPSLSLFLDCWRAYCCRAIKKNRHFVLQCRVLQGFRCGLF